VSRHCRGCDAAAVVDVLAQGDGLLGRVVVVGQRAVGGDDADIIDAVVVKHFLGYLGSRQAGTEPDLRILGKPAPERALYEQAQNRENDKY